MTLQQSETDVEDEEKDSQVYVFRKAAISQALEWRADGVEEWPRRVALLAEKGALSTGLLTLGSIARECLFLVQISYVVDEDVQAAFDHLVFPVNLPTPSFREIAGLVKEGVTGTRVWDGKLLSIEGQLERVLCFILSDRISDLEADYTLYWDESLVRLNEEKFVRSFLTRQLLRCALGHYKNISFENYEKKLCFSKRSFFYGYEKLIEAIALGDELMFSHELKLREAAFIRRRKSVQSDRTWGYGYVGQDCFDVFGTALCRLAVKRGFTFPAPNARLYPDDFWRPMTSA